MDVGQHVDDSTNSVQMMPMIPLRL